MFSYSLYKFNIHRACSHCSLFFFLISPLGNATNKKDSHRMCNTEYCMVTWYFIASLLQLHVASKSVTERQTIELEHIQE